MQLSSEAFSESSKASRTNERKGTAAAGRPAERAGGLADKRSSAPSQPASQRVEMKLVVTSIWQLESTQSVCRLSVASSIAFTTYVTTLSFLDPLSHAS